RIYKGISKKEEKKKKLPKEKKAEEEIPEKAKKKKAPKIILKNREKFWLVYDYVRKYRKHVLRLFKFKLLKWDFKASLGDYFNTGLAYAIYWFLYLPSKGVYFFPVFNGNGKNGGNVSLMYEGEINASLTLYMHRMWWLGIRLSLDEGYRRYFPYANRKRVPRWRKKLDKSKTGTYYTPTYGPLGFEKAEKREANHYYTTTYHDKSYYKKRWEEKARSLS
ncbi:MAG: hypothetical protein JXA60_11875, partial [Candidatus Coatesbacteria bacterium]|nr:hypothetical protein [Candidatus Coatesbacteria bacterium]